MAAFIDSTELTVPYLNGRYYQAKLDGLDVFTEVEDPYPPYYKDPRDCLLLVRADSVEGVTDYYVHIPAGARIGGYNEYKQYTVITNAWNIYVYKLSDPSNITEYNVTFSNTYSTGAATVYSMSGYDIKIDPDIDYVVGIAPQGSYSNRGWLVRFGTQYAYMNANSTDAQNVNNIRAILNINVESMLAIDQASGSDGPANGGATDGFLAERFAKWTNLKKCIDHSYLTNTIYLMVNAGYTEGYPAAGNNYIMYRTFDYCTSLERVKLPKISPAYVGARIFTFGNYCFYFTFRRTALKSTVKNLFPMGDEYGAPQVVWKNYQYGMYSQCDNLETTYDHECEPSAPYLSTNSTTIDIDMDQYTVEEVFQMDSFQGQKYSYCSRLTNGEKERSLINIGYGEDSTFTLYDFRHQTYMECTSLTVAPAECRWGIHDPTLRSLAFRGYRYMMFDSCTKLTYLEDYGIFETIDSTPASLNSNSRDYRAYQFYGCNKLKNIYQNGDNIIIPKAEATNMYDYTGSIVGFLRNTFACTAATTFSDNILVRYGNRTVTPDVPTRALGTPTTTNDPRWCGYAIFENRRMPVYSHINSYYKSY